MIQVSPFRLVAALALTSSVLAFAALPARSEGDPAPPVRRGPTRLDPRTSGVGLLVPDVAFTDLDGRPGRLADYRGKALVALCLTAPCPLSRRYGPTHVRLAEEFAQQGAALLVVAVGDGDSKDDVVAARKRHPVPGRWIHDADGALSRALGVRSSTDAFVLDGARTLTYRGAVDDRYGIGYARDAARHEYLRDAVAATLAGRAPAVEATTAPGCEVSVPAAGGAEQTSPAGPTYHAEVARIVLRSCAGCHREGGAGPFVLTDYASVRRHRATLRRVVSDGTMPPWFADPRHSVPMENDASLSKADRDVLLTWLRNDAPEGDPADAPLPRKRRSEWAIGTPDLVFETPRVVEVQAEGTMPYQYQIVRTELDEDRWVRAFEVRPDHPEVVHHVLVFAHWPASHPRFEEQPNDLNGLAGYFAAMVPGQNHLVFPEGTGRFLPRGTRLRFQVHYTPNGTAVNDRVRLGLRFTDGPPDREVHADAAYDARFRIPPGAPRHRVAAKMEFPAAGRILSLTPHMHLRGTAFRYRLRRPGGGAAAGGESVDLLSVPRYDFNWQLNYRLREPLRVEAGTVLECEAWFDNSPGNPANPDPSRTVRFGEQTSDEMMIGYVEWVGEQVIAEPAPAAGER